MSYSIVYSSRTGNTALLAQYLQATLPAEELLYCGAPDSRAQEATIVFAGFWTDKGSSDEVASAFLKTLCGKRSFCSERRALAAATFILRGS